MNLINEKLALITEINENKKKARQKVIILIIIEMFRIPDEEINLIEKLIFIDIMISRLLNQLTRINKDNILNSLRDDKQKAMDHIVTTLINFFDPEQDWSVAQRFYKLSNNYFKGYLKNSESLC